MKYFNNPIHFGTEIVFCSLCKIRFLFADSQVRPDTKLGRRESNTLPLGLHPTPYYENVSIGQSRRLHACVRVNRVIASLDKIRQNVYITVRILEPKISVECVSDRPVGTFHDRTFHIWIFVNLKLNAFMTYHVLILYI